MLKRTAPSHARKCTSYSVQRIKYRVRAPPSNPRSTAKLETESTPAQVARVTVLGRQPQSLADRISTHSHTQHHSSSSLSLISSAMMYRDPSPDPLGEVSASASSFRRASSSLYLVLLSLSHRRPSGSLPSGVQELIPSKTFVCTAIQLTITMTMRATRGIISCACTRFASLSSSLLLPLPALARAARRNAMR